MKRGCDNVPRVTSAEKACLGNDQMLCHIILFGVTLGDMVGDALGKKQWKVIEQANKKDKWPPFYGLGTNGNSYQYDTYETHVSRGVGDRGRRCGDWTQPAPPSLPRAAHGEPLQLRANRRQGAAFDARKIVQGAPATLRCAPPRSAEINDGSFSRQCWLTHPARALTTNAHLVPLGSSLAQPCFSCAPPPPGPATFHGRTTSRPTPRDS